MNRNFWLFVEKVVATYLEALIGLYLADAADLLNTVPIERLAIAALPAAIAVISASIPAPSGALPYFTQLVLNVARTYVQGLAGFLLAIVPFELSFSIGEAALVAALPAALAVLKGGLSKYIGSTETPNALPTRLDPAVPGAFRRDPLAA